MLHSKCASGIIHSISLERLGPLDIWRHYLSFPNLIFGPLQSELTGSWQFAPSQCSTGHEKQFLGSLSAETGKVRTAYKQRGDRTGHWVHETGQKPGSQWAIPSILLDLHGRCGPFFHIFCMLLTLGQRGVSSPLLYWKPRSQYCQNPLPKSQTINPFPFFILALNCDPGKLADRLLLYLLSLGGLGGNQGLTP